MMSYPETYEVYAIQYCHRSNRSKAETFLSPVLSADFHDVAQDITYYVWLITNENRTVLVDTGFGRGELARRQAALRPGWQPGHARPPARAPTRTTWPAEGLFLHIDISRWENT